MATTKPCPRCDRIDAVASVKAIVLGSTSVSISSSVHMHPSFSLDGNVQWSLDYGEAINVTRSVLASQLGFPDKASGTMEVGWLVTVSSITGIFGFYALANSLHTERIANGYITPSMAAIYTCIALFLACLAGSFLGFFVALDATFKHYTGKSAAYKLWEGLYYCFRDNVVYAPGDAS